MPTLPEELKHFLARYDEKPKLLVQRLREIVLQELAPCHEYIFAMRSGRAARKVIHSPLGN